MAHRGARDRDPRDDRNERRRPREPEERREPPRPSGPRQVREQLNEFFVDGDGIHREVLQREICKYLGPEAYSKPGTYNGINGYVIKAVRPFTQKMLDDLIELSDAYVLENRSLRQRGHQDIPYGDSQTSRRQDSILNGSGADDAYGQDRYATQLSYSAAGPQPGYPTPGQPNGYPGPAYPPGPGYSQVSTYPSGSGYPAPSYLATAQPGTNYTYRDDYPSSVDPYRQTGAYPSAGRPREVRAERAEPRYPGPDMRDLRMDPRDPRADPRADPRNLPNYSSYVTSPGDVSMRDADPGYDYVSALPTVQSGRGGSFAPSRVAPSGYDPRDSPLRDGYRNEPIREERRRR